MICSVSIAADVEPVAVDLDELEWGLPGGGNGFPVGVHTATQGVDPVSGGRTYYCQPLTESRIQDVFR